MRLLALIAGIVLLAVGQSASAADAKKDTTPGTSVEMPYLIAPLSDGQELVAYAYVSCKIVGSSPAAAMEIRDKVPFIQDAFVRDVNRAGIGKPDNPTAVDPVTLTARLLALAKKVVGPSKVTDLKLMQVQITPLRPGSIPATSPS